MTTDTKQNPAGERVEEPAKRWRNWWRATEDGIGAWHRQDIKAGDIFDGRVDWPSKDVAEQAALDDLALIERKGLARKEYLGAFPEGQRP